MLVREEVRRVEPGENCSSVYVGQRELAVVAPADNIQIVGSDSATTCLVVLLRHQASGVAGVGHLDTPSEVRRYIQALLSVQ